MTAPGVQLSVAVLRMMHPSLFDAIPSEILLALDNQLCFALHAAARSVQRAYQPLLVELDLTYPQYLVMLVLWEWDSENEPRPTLGALGQRLALDSGTLTPLLRRLEQKGLLVRERSNADGRELFVHVTRAGRALKKQARAVPIELICRSPVPVNEMVTLREQLKKFRALLSQGTT
ncbi:MAG TPA: MarR family transcriptional regulator [Polyangiales bacterium]